MQVFPHGTSLGESSRTGPARLVFSVPRTSRAGPSRVASLTAMDLNTVVEIRDAREPRPWRPGDAWLGGGTYLFSEPQPHLRRLVDLSRTDWEPVRRHPDGSLEIAATCTIA